MNGSAAAATSTPLSTSTSSRAIRANRRGSCRSTTAETTCIPTTQVTSRWDRPFLCDYFAKISTPAIGSALGFRRPSAVRQCESAYARRAFALHRSGIRRQVEKLTFTAVRAAEHGLCTKKSERKRMHAPWAARMEGQAEPSARGECVGVWTVACRHQCCDQRSGSYLKES